MSWPPPDRRYRLVWFDNRLADPGWHCACGGVIYREWIAIRHAARCPIVANRRRFAERRRLGRPLDGALRLSVRFRFRWPPSTRRKRDTRTERDKTTAPDLSKLVRSLEDGSQAAGLITDDARIAYIDASKHDVVDEWTGVSVIVREVEG